MHFQDAPINCISSRGEKGEGEEAGRGEGEEKASDPENADRPPSIFLLANKWRVGDKVLEDKLQVKRCLTLWRGDTG